MTASAPTRVSLPKRATAFIASLALALALAPVAPGVPSAQATPALDVTFNASTGIATWKAYPGAAAYWYECDDKLGGGDGHGFSSLVSGEPDSVGYYTVDFKELLDNAVTCNSTTVVSSYEISVYATDTEAVSIATWSANFTYTPTKKTFPPIAGGLNVDAATGNVTWAPVTGAFDYQYDVEEGWNPQVTSETYFNAKTFIDDSIAAGAVAKAADNKYTLVVIARDDSAEYIAKSTVVFTYDSSAVPAPPNTLNATFDAAGGVATWPVCPGANAYWYSVDDSSAPLGNVTEADFKALLDTLYTEGVIGQKSPYEIGVTAYADDTPVAQWGTTFAYSPKKVTGGGGTPDPSLPAMTVSFDTANGKAAWSAVAGANTYWCGIGDKWRPLGNVTSADFSALIDKLYTDGVIEKTGSYEIGVGAYTDSTPVAQWSTTFAYSPKKVTGTTPDSSLPALAVSFDATSADASWGAYAGSDTYWFSIDEGLHPLGANTNTNFKTLLDLLYTQGTITQKSTYTVGVTAYASGTPVAQWKTTLAYTPQKLASADIDPALPSMPATFNASTGKAAWAAYPSADAYSYSIDGKGFPQAHTSVDFAKRIDELAAQGLIAKKSSYSIVVQALSAGTPIAQWYTTFSYTPKAPSGLAIPGIDSAAKLSVTFNAGTGKASWSAYAGAKTYLIAVESKMLATRTTGSVDFKDAIDGLYLNGDIAKKSSYEIAVVAYANGVDSPAAAWSTTYTYAPAPSIARASITGIGSTSYTGKKVKPKPTVQIGIVTLKQGTHYSLSYKNNKKVGKATVTIKGKGLVGGKATKKFKILPKEPGLKLVSVGKKKATVKLKSSMKGTKGMELRYGYNQTMKKAKKKSFKGAKKRTIKLKKLKSGKTCFVWARSWTKVKGKKWYSQWNGFVFEPL